MAKTSHRRRNGWIFSLALLLALLILFPVYRKAPAERLDDALFAAARSHDASAVRSLLSQGANPNAQKPSPVPQSAPSGIFSTPLLAATELIPEVLSDNRIRHLAPPPEIFQALLERGANPNIRNEAGDLPLISVGKFPRDAAGGELCRLLVKYGADVNAADSTGTTALMHASFVGSTETVKALLRCHADLNVQARTSGETALLLALTQEHLDVANILVEAGADVHIGARTGITAKSLCLDQSNTTSDATQKARYTALLHRIQQARAAHPATSSP